MQVSKKRLVRPFPVFLLTPSTFEIPTYVYEELEKSSVTKQDRHVSGVVVPGGGVMGTIRCSRYSSRF